MSLNKIFLPAVLGLVGLAFAGGVVLYWVTEIIHLSFRSDGTLFSKYSTTPAAIHNPHPTQAFWCDSAYLSRWAGCNIK